MMETTLFVSDAPEEGDELEVLVKASSDLDEYQDSESHPIDLKIRSATKPRRRGELHIYFGIDAASYLYDKLGEALRLAEERRP